LRGTISLFAMPAHLGEAKLIQAVSLLERTKAPFLDLADGDNWVQTPEAILLTGHASRTITLNSARIRWQAFVLPGK